MCTRAAQSVVSVWKFFCTRLTLQCRLGYERRVCRKLRSELSELVSTEVHLESGYSGPGSGIGRRRGWTRRFLRVVRYGCQLVVRRLDQSAR